MRPINFRGKRIDNGEWVEGSLVDNVFFRAETKEPICYIIDTNAISKELGSEYTDWEDIFSVIDMLEVDPATVGQFTGLQDKNGVDIFEGDIYRVGYFAINDEKKFGEKPWENLPESQDEEELTTIIDELLEVEPPHIRSISSLYDLIHNDPDIIGVEITGNIHDTPSEKGE